MLASIIKVNYAQGLNIAAFAGNFRKSIQTQDF